MTKLIMSSIIATLMTGYLHQAMADGLPQPIPKETKISPVVNPANIVQEAERSENSQPFSPIPTSPPQASSTLLSTDADKSPQAPFSSSKPVGQESLTTQPRTKAINLKPRVLIRPPSEVEHTVDYQILKPFLKQVLEVTQKDYQQAPRLVATTSRQDLITTDSQVIVKEALDSEILYYQITNKPLTYRHPKTLEILGMGASVDGEAKLVNAQKPGLLQVTKAHVSLDLGARIFPRSDYQLPNTLTLKPAATLKRGYIVGGGDSFDLGRNDTVMISLGKREYITPGDVFDIYQPIGIMNDKQVAKLLDSNRVPLQKAGQLMVYHSFDKMSLALIFQSDHPINLQAVLKAP